jgi:hypothetical protein
MKVIDIADEIYRELDQPNIVSIPMIVFWCGANVGKLNLLLHEEIEFVDNEFSPELSVEQAAVLKILYIISYYSKQMASHLGAGAYDWSELTEGDTRIRRVSKNEIAKNYSQLRSSYSAELDELVYRYKNNQVIPGEGDLFYVSWT